VGLEAALYGATLGYDTVIYEAGCVGENLRRWGHVTLFSPWRMNHTPLGWRTLRSEGSAVREPHPDDLLPGREHRRLYLEPLSRSLPLKDRILEHHRVISIGREGLLKGEGVADPRRAQEPFRILLETPEGETSTFADRVLDASGTYGHANWLGDGGIPAVGERAARARISYLLDDPVGSDRALYEGRRILLVGSGLSAATSLLALQRLRAEAPSTSVLWATRSTEPHPYALVRNDPLPGRATLMEQANGLGREEGPAIRRLPGRVVTSLAVGDEGFRVCLRNGSRIEAYAVDRVLANVGYRPDRTLYSELQVHECYASEGPMKLASVLLSGGAVDCLAQTGHGPGALVNPEPGFFVVGAKSYGRNSSFLMHVGFEQIRDVFRVITGDDRLDLYGERRETTA
jgi:hypothetical protein